MKRFLDTRGLGEVAYDPAADLAEAAQSAHMALVLMRLDDPVQGMVAEVLPKLRRARVPVILVHTAGDLLPEAGARARMRTNNLKIAEAAYGSLPSVELDLAKPETADLQPLTEALQDLLPSVVAYLAKTEARDAEEAEFADSAADPGVADELQPGSERWQPARNGKAQHARSGAQQEKDPPVRREIAKQKLWERGGNVCHLARDQRPVLAE